MGPGGHKGDRGLGAMGESGAVVEVRAAARLHLGFLDPAGDLGRRFLGLGLAVDRPRTVLRARRATRTAVRGPEADRTARILGRLRPLFGTFPVEIEVLRAIPPHAGFGSGTQLTLAVGRALAALAKRPFDAQEVARLALRGRRSGLGIAAFERGGFLLDAGKGDDDRPPPLLARLRFPADWRVLLLRDPAREGLSGEAEDQAFRELPPFPGDLAARLARLALSCVLSGVALADLALFGRGIREIQDRLGDWYAPFQGGRRWASPLVGAALDHLRAGGVPASGQSSWGPTGFAVVPASAARSLRAELRRRFPGLQVDIARGRAGGARLRVLDGRTAALATAHTDAEMV
ncbi:hypothetical protein HRbin39_00653 [bacterium HR39]|nr:hypothetical protein HRbin39_00653 [bacterium HR39]